MIETVLMRQEYGLSVCVTTRWLQYWVYICASGLLKNKEI